MKSLHISQIVGPSVNQTVISSKKITSKE